MLHQPPETAEEALSQPYVGTAEAALILDCEKPRIGRYVKAGLMPPHVIKLKATKVWRTKDVVALRDGLAARENRHQRVDYRPPSSVRPAALVGTSEAAELLGVERTRIGRWLQTDKIIPPLVWLKAGPVWAEKDLKPFAREAAA